jgi:hypothetical protein
MSRPKF